MTDRPGAPLLDTHSVLFNPTAKGIPAIFPFSVTASLRPLIDAFESRAAQHPERYDAVRREVDALLAAVPSLSEATLRPHVLEEHEDDIRRLVDLVAPGWAQPAEMKALVAPFGPAMVLPSPRMRREFLGTRATTAWTGMLAQSTRYGRMLYAYKAILRRFYGAEMELDQPVILVVHTVGGATARYMKIIGDSQFISVEATGPVPELTTPRLEHLLRHVDDMGLWMEWIPPAGFRFRGISILSFTDVTNEVATAVLKEILLASDANLTEENFDLVQREVQTLFRRPSLQLGLASVQADGALNFSSERKIWNSLRIRDAVRGGLVSLDETLYQRVLTEGEIVVLEHLSDAADTGADVELLKARGVGSILVAPLRYGGKIVGLLELSSPDPGDLQGLATLKLRQIESIFALAVHQNLERFENRVESIIQATYTSIHPTVAWRFREAAITMLEREKKGGGAEPEEIVFSDLYPLFGSADVRGSSRHRGESVRRDLVEHLELATSVLNDVRRLVPMMLIDEMRHRIDAHLARMGRDWSPEDERAAAALVQHEVNPFLRIVGEEHPDIAPLLETYWDASQGRSLISTRRDGYEASLSQINQAISRILDAAQFELQAVFPHYFEKHQTDGVEHTMYVGASIVPGRTFDRAYLRNLRLRQLITACEVTRSVERIKPELPVPLEVTQLILVQNQPLTIRFRLDEKTFDVDGGDSVRYEIVKKRVDKARLRDSQERVAQPGQIAIVYSLEEEAVEYLRYCGFLAARGLLHDDIEHLELEDLPGASRLRALRVAVVQDVSSAGVTSEGVHEFVRQVAEG